MSLALGADLISSGAEHTTVLENPKTSIRPNNADPILTV
jgi:hypothetical protein